MIFTAERLAQTLQSQLGVALVTVASDTLRAHRVDGQTPALVCSPSTPDQVAIVLRVCAEVNAVVMPWGGGTAVSVGNVPRQTTVVMDLTRLNRIIDHDPANLTVTVQSGTTLASLQGTLAPERQFLPFDAPRPAQATIGGTVAVNLNGPRRAYYGAIRDLVIGMKAALITGEQIKAGGKVVKNVAGYDMCKLFTGSLGSLGIITEVTVRVAPVSETAATVIVSGSFNEVEEYVRRLYRSPLLPAAVILMNFQFRQSTGTAWQVAVWCEGFEEAVARHLSEAQGLARQLALETAILRGADHEALWNEIRDFPLTAERSVYRATLPRAALEKFIEALNRTGGLVPALIADTSIGTIWLSWPVNEQPGATWRQLAALAAAHRGHAVMFSAPHQVKKGLDVWGPPPPSLSLMRGLKQRFDPQGLLNPGRFVGGI